MYQTLDEICNTMVKWLREDEPGNPAWSPELWALFRRVSFVHGVSARLHWRLKDVPWLSNNMKVWLFQ